MSGAPPPAAGARRNNCKGNQRSLAQLWKAHTVGFDDLCDDLVIEIFRKIGDDDSATLAATRSVSCRFRKLLDASYSHIFPGAAVKNPWQPPPAAHAGARLKILQQLKLPHLSSEEPKPDWGAGSGKKGRKPTMSWQEVVKEKKDAGTPVTEKQAKQIQASRERGRRHSATWIEKPGNREKDNARSKEYQRKGRQGGDEHIAALQQAVADKRKTTYHSKTAAGAAERKAARDRAFDYLFLKSAEAGEVNWERYPDERASHDGYYKLWNKDFEASDQDFATFRSFKSLKPVAGDPRYRWVPDAELVKREVVDDAQYFQLDSSKELYSVKDCAATIICGEPKGAGGRWLLDMMLQHGPVIKWGVNETTAAELAGTTRGQTSDGYNYKAGMTYTTQPYLDAGVQPQTKQSHIDQFFIFADGKAAGLDVKCVTTMWHLKYSINNMAKPKAHIAFQPKPSCLYTEIITSVYNVYNDERGSRKSVVVVGEKLKDGDRGLLQYYSTCEELGQCPKDSVEVRNEGIDETGRTPIWMRHNRGGLLYKLLGNTDITWSADWQQQLHTEIQRLQAKVAADAAAADTENEAATPQRKRQRTAARAPLSPKAPPPPPLPR